MDLDVSGTLNTAITTAQFNRSHWQSGRNTSNGTLGNYKFPRRSASDFVVSEWYESQFIFHIISRR